MADCLCFPLPHRELPPDDSPVAMLADAVLLSYAALAACELGFFAALASGPATLSELSSRLGLAAEAVEVLAVASASVGLVSRRGETVAALPVAKVYLGRGSRLAMAPLVELERRLVREAYSYDALLAALKTAPTRAGRRPWTEGFLGSEEETRHFIAAMHAHSLPAADVWTRRLDLGAHRVMLDLGGGSGAHALAAAAANPRLHAWVLDFGPVCDLAAQYITRAGLGERVGVWPADFWRDPLPAADLHFFGDVFHDWPIERALELARKSFAALPRGGVILVHEMLLDETRSGPPVAAASALAMLLLTGGRQFSARELTRLLAAAGFVGIEVVPGLGCWSVVRGRKP